MTDIIPYNQYIMLSNIQDHWPPDLHPSTGYKQHHTAYVGQVNESMENLHDPAWWTGFRISSPTYKGESTIRLLKRDGTPAFALYPEIPTIVGEWTPFPWPIPGKMATEMVLYVECPGLDTHTYSLRLSFQEMTRLSIHERYLFVENSEVHHVWNGRRKAWGNRTEGAEPAWRTFHTLVPPMKRLLSEPAWDDYKPFCIHAWDESVKME
jgi:hypothetical protein